jgi:hypothetical protein
MANSTLGGRRARTVIGGAIAATALLPASAAWAGGRPQPPPTTEVVATGLLNPRGVEVGLDGSVYVAESGAGGPTLAQGLIAGEPGPVCLGNTGVVEKFRRGRRTVVGNFDSLTAAAVADDGTASCDPGTIGAESVGPSDIAVHLDGSIAVSMGLGGNVDIRSGFPAPFADQFGKLLSVNRRGQVSEIADITAYEHTANPDQGEDDSNPYGVASFFGTHYVADAGGNDVVAVDRRGNVSTLAVIPGPGPLTTPSPCGPPVILPPAQAVPTTVAIGPDGAVYVGQLTGFPFTPGVAKVFRVDRRTGEVTTFAEGFTNIVGIAWGLDRSLYVLEIARDGLLCGPPQGRLVKIKRGVQTEVAVEGGLSAPGGVAVGLDNTIYVTNHSTEPGGAGELLAIHQ